MCPTMLRAPQQALDPSGGEGGGEQTLQLLILSLPSQGVTQGQRSCGRVVCLQGCAVCMLLCDASV